MADLEMATLVPDPLEEVAPPRGQHGAAAWAVWLARRLGLAVLTLWLVSILVFVATATLGDPVRAILGRDYNANPGRVAELEEMLGADQGLVARYFDWLGGLLTGDLGTSLASGQPVSELISSSVQNSAMLVFLGGDRDDPAVVHHRDDLGALPPPASGHRDPDDPAGHGRTARVRHRRAADRPARDDGLPDLPAR